MPTLREKSLIWIAQLQTIANEMEVAGLGESAEHLDFVVIDIQTEQELQDNTRQPFA